MPTKIALGGFLLVDAAFSMATRLGHEANCEAPTRAR